MFKDLLIPDYGEDDSPPDGTKITQVILYFDEKDALELKRLAKEAMKAEMPDYIEKGNLSDILLLILKKHYGKTNFERVHIGQGVRKDAGEVLGGGFI